MRGPRLSVILAYPSGTRTAPIGTLSQKIHCQARPSVTAPPTTGPPTTARPVSAVNTPSAAPRRAAATAPASSATAAGMTSAEPAPCTVRATMSVPVSGASAQTTEASVNTPSPAANVRRRPNRSPAAAPVISSTAKVKV